MAYMDRGDSPSIEIGDTGDSSDVGFYEGPYYYGRYYTYIPLDNTYVLMQMIVTFIILIVGIIAFVTTYKSPIVDPIEGTKNLFIYSHLIIIAILLSVTLAVNSLSKDEAKLIKRLFIIFIVSVIVLLLFLGIRLNLDTIYNKEKFEEFYYEQNIEDENDITKSKIDIGITGVSVKTERQYYIDKSVEAYTIFQIRTYSILFLHLLLNILLIYQIVRVSKLKKKKDRLSKDDIVVFDEEENVKI